MLRNKIGEREREREREHRLQDKYTNVANTVEFEFNIIEPMVFCETFSCVETDT